MVYSALDIFFCFFHTSLIFFNLMGWGFVKTRKLHLYSISITLFSWVGLGFFYGWGYCFLTDWHYQILYKLGETQLPQSYITYLLKRFLNLELDDSTVMNWTAITFIVILLVSYTQWAYSRLLREP